MATVTDDPYLPDAAGRNEVPWAEVGFGWNVVLFDSSKAAALSPSDVREGPVVLYLVDAGGQIVGQADSQPVEGHYPTSIWDPGEIVVDEHRIAAPPGEYQVYVGLYQWETSTRLSAALDGERIPDDRLLLGVVKVP